jgi:hypothetical protein
MIYSEPIKVRKISQRSKGITIPSDSIFQVGDELTIYYGNFILITPKSKTINEYLLKSISKEIEEGE